MGRLPLAYRTWLGMTVHTQQFDSPLFKGKVSVHTNLFINGEFVDPQERHDIE